MIQTTISELKRYCLLHSYFPTAFGVLAEMSQHEFVKGKQTVLENQIYVNALEYDTQPEQHLQMEAHREYIDIMLMLEGEEIIKYCPASAISKITKEYDPAGDAMLGEIVPDASSLTMKEGTVAIFFPEDAHAPGMVSSERQRVRKLIAKVAIR